MATFTLNADTAKTIFDQNDDETGFVLITTAVPGQRHYRISRERTTLTTILDYFDFYLDLTGVAGGTEVTKAIPYIPSLFSVGPTPRDLSEVLTDSSAGGFSSPGTPISGEKFKLLHLTSTVEGDPSREMPSYINTMATYTMSGVPRPIRYIYYILVNGIPRYASPQGNIAFDDQYDHSIVIDPTKRIDVKTVGGIDYHIIRVSTTPGLVVGKGVAKPSSTLSDTYDDGIFRYSLRATSHSTQAWIGENGVKSNGFYVVLKILGLVDEHSMQAPIQRDIFYITPKASIGSAVVSALSAYEFQFLIRPKVGITSMDLRITRVGAADDLLVSGSPLVR
jgi:hypothetical protein